VAKQNQLYILTGSTGHSALFSVAKRRHPHESRDRPCASPLEGGTDRRGVERLTEELPPGMRNIAWAVPRCLASWDHDVGVARRSLPPASTTNGGEGLSAPVRLDSSCSRRREQANLGCMPGMKIVLGVAAPGPKADGLGCRHPHARGLGEASFLVRSRAGWPGCGRFVPVEAAGVLDRASFACGTGGCCYALRYSGASVT